MHAQFVLERCVCVCQDMFKSRPCHFFVSCKSASMLNTNGFQTLSIAALRQRRRHLLPTRFSGYDLSNCFGSCHSVWHSAGFQGWRDGLQSGVRYFVSQMHWKCCVQAVLPSRSEQSEAKAVPHAEPLESAELKMHRGSQGSRELTDGRKVSWEQTVWWRSLHGCSCEASLSLTGKDTAHLFRFGLPSSCRILSIYLSI